MEIIKDATRERVEEYEKLKQRIIDDILKSEYNCDCGITYKVTNINDIRLCNDVVFMYELYKAIYTRCPHCNRTHFYVDFPPNTTLQEKMLEDQNLSRDIYYTIKDMKKKVKVSLKERIKRWFKSEI